MLRSLLLTALLVAVLSLPAAANLLPNPSFEAGRGQPEGWHISAGGVGRWESFGHTGQRSLSVTGKGEDNLWWAPAAPLVVQPGALYHTSFWERYSAGDGWGIVSGLSVVNRDYRGSADWTRHDFFARVPDNVQSTTFRLGEWHAQGTLCFDDVSLTPAFAVQSEPEGFDRPLGSGESVTDGSYLCQHDMAGPGANDHRCLASTTATFNTNRWVFARDAQVTYHHVLGRLRQTDAEVMVNVNYYQQGTLALEASADGTKWVLLGRTNKLGRVGFPVPLPAGREVWIRLRAEGEADLQVDSYQYRCALPDAPRGARYTGETRYFDLLRSDPTTQVSITRAAFRPTGENVVALSITPSTRRTVEALLTVEQAGATVASARATAQVTPSRTATLDLRYTLRTTGEHVLRLRLQDPGQPPDPVGGGEPLPRAAALLGRRGRGARLQSAHHALVVRTRAQGQPRPPRPDRARRRAPHQPGRERVRGRAARRDPAHRATRACASPPATSSAPAPPVCPAPK